VLHQSVGGFDDVADARGLGCQRPGADGCRQQHAIAIDDVGAGQRDHLRRLRARRRIA